MGALFLFVFTGRSKCKKKSGREDGFALLVVKLNIKISAALLILLLFTNFFIFIYSLVLTCFFKCVKILEQLLLRAHVYACESRTYCRLTLRGCRVLNKKTKGETQMKKRRLVITTFLLLAVLVMGIGYAALTDNLFIKGEATLATTSAQSNFDEDVYFTTATVVSGTGGTNTGTPDSASIGATDKDSATFYVKSLGNANESVQFKFTIQNDSTEFDANITLDTGYPTTTDATNFTITYSIASDAANDAAIVCAAGDTVEVYVTVLLKNTPMENQSAAFNVNLTATSVPKA